MCFVDWILGVVYFYLYKVEFFFVEGFGDFVYCDVYSVFVCFNVFYDYWCFKNDYVVFYFYYLKVKSLLFLFLNILSFILVLINLWV